LKVSHKLRSGQTGLTLPTSWSFFGRAALTPTLPSVLIFETSVMFARLDTGRVRCIWVSSFCTVSFTFYSPPFRSAPVAYSFPVVANLKLYCNVYTVFIAGARQF